MSDFKKNIGMLRDRRRKQLPVLQLNASTPEKDLDGSASNILAGTLRFVAVADYLLDGDVGAFRIQISAAADLRQSLFDRFDSGAPVSASYVSMMSYKGLFNALAGGNSEHAKSFSRKMGGRQVIEAEYDRPFDVALGYSMKSLLASDDAEANRRIGEFAESCQVAENRDFQGYAKVLRAIFNKDGESASNGLADVIAGHKRQCKSGGLFKGSEDEVLCVWGIGLANLGRICGVPMQVDDQLIPSNLLI